MNQWRNPVKQVSKCWTGFTYSLIEGNFDTLLSTAVSSSSPHRRTWPPTWACHNKSSLKLRTSSTSSYRLWISRAWPLSKSSTPTSSRRPRRIVFFTNHLDLHVHTQFVLNVVLGVADLATPSFIWYPLDKGGTMIDTSMCVDPSTHLPYQMRNGISLPLRRTGDAALFCGSTHVHRTLSPPDGFIVLKLVLKNKIRIDYRSLCLAD